MMLMMLKAAAKHVSSQYTQNRKFKRKHYIKRTVDRLKQHSRQLLADQGHVLAEAIQKRTRACGRDEREGSTV